jgi:hypothetical protein
LLGLAALKGRQVLIETRSRLRCVGLPTASIRSPGVERVRGLLALQEILQPRARGDGVTTLGTAKPTTRLEV